MPKTSGTPTFGLIGQTYIDPNEGTERTFRDVNELLSTLEKNDAMNSPMGNELRILQQASKDSGIPLQTLYEYRQATSGPMASRNAHLFNPETAGLLENAMQGLTSLGPSGGGGLFNELSRALGSGLGAVSENVIGPLGETVKENPALLYGAPFAVAALAGAGPLGLAGSAPAAAGGIAAPLSAEHAAMMAAAQTGGSLGLGLEAGALASLPGLAASTPFVAANPALSGVSTSLSRLLDGPVATINDALPPVTDADLAQLATDVPFTPSHSGFGADVATSQLGNSARNELLSDLLSGAGQAMGGLGIMANFNQAIPASQPLAPLQTGQNPLAKALVRQPVNIGAQRSRLAALLGGL